MRLPEDDREHIRLQVAQRLGWTELEYTSSGVLRGRAPQSHSFASVPSYARDIRASWEIVERVRSKGLAVKIQYSAGMYTVQLGDERRGLGVARDDEITRALCAAFLQMPNIPNG